MKVVSDPLAGGLVEMGPGGRVRLEWPIVSVGAPDRVVSVGSESVVDSAEVEVGTGSVMVTKTVVVSERPRGHIRSRVRVEDGLVWRRGGRFWFEYETPWAHAFETTA